MSTTKSIVLVTGANQGLGLEIVRSLAKSTSAAYSIFLGSRSIPNAEAAIKSIQSELPGSASNLQPVQVDIADDDSIARAYKTVEAAAGRVDVLVFPL